MPFGMPPGPRPPQDQYLRDTIDKMAAFVARNGPGVEETTRQKQSGNETFSFLYDRDQFNPYYRFRVDMELSYLRNGPPPAGPSGPPPGHQNYPPTPQHDQQHRGPPPMTPQPGPSTSSHQANPETSAARQQIDACRAAIKQSEQNLQAQHDSIPLIKDAQLLQGAIDAENSKIATLLQQVKLDVAPLTNMLEQLNGKASKDAVVSCKKWILDSCQTDQQREIILLYLQHRIRETSSSDSFRIHILYLINDWAHHCQRKKLTGQTAMLSRYVPKMFAWISEAAQNRASANEKLEKLVGTWEGHKYFNEQCFKQLRNPLHIYSSDRTALLTENRAVLQTIEAQLTAMLSGYEAQHNEFCKHQMNQIKMLEAQIAEAERPEVPKSLLDLKLAPPPQMDQPRRSRFDQTTANSFASERFQPAARGEERYHGEDDEDIDGIEYNEEDLVPKCEYWDTPAALMKPRIDMHEFAYKPMDPKAIRLDPPIKPPPALRHAMDRFYAEGPDTAARDGCGWELNALASFFERKAHMRAIQMEKLTAEGKTLEDLITNKMTQDDLDEELRAVERARIEAMDEAAANCPPLSSFIQKSAAPVALGMDNKGAQLMAKMGWKGTGLGAKETGIQVPINAGEVRDKNEMYKGLGQGTDIYEDFRSKVASGFAARNKHYAEKRANQHGRDGY
ncbi:unnamed protein product, partial [Mesorhabditis spiculigera]